MRWLYKLRLIDPLATTVRAGDLATVEGLVRARSPHEARRFMMNLTGDPVWLSKENCFCEVVRADGPSNVLMVRHENVSNYVVK